MGPTRCLSSHAMSHLLTWRNPYGREEEWKNYDEDDEINWSKLRNKAIVTELALLALLPCATIETITYLVLTLLTIPLYPFTNRPFSFVENLLESSTFTIPWILVDLVLNIFVINVATHESSARYLAARNCLTICRPVDNAVVSKIRNAMSGS